MRWPARRAWFGALLVCGALLPVTFSTLQIQRSGLLMGDFRAFYCAGAAIRSGRDPYRTEPLRTCENLSHISTFRKHPATVIPAPLPGYDLAPFVPLSRLPYRAAAAIFALLALAAAGICVITVARVSAIPLGVVAALFSFVLAAQSLPFGEIVPAAIAAVCVAGWFAYRDDWTGAAVAGAFSMIEPHLGLPVCVALALWVPRTRPVLAISAALLGAISLATTGLSGNLEYLMQVLPAHALSEAGRDTQYSLTALLVNAHVSDTDAVRAGTVFYAIMLLTGSIVAGIAVRRTKANALLVFVPPAFAVLGGPFMHITEIAVAIPAALLLTAAGGSKLLASVTLLLLAIPWWLPFAPFAISLAPVIPAAVFVAFLYKGNLRAAALTATCAALAIIALTETSRLPLLNHAHAYAASTISPGLAEHQWAAFVSESSTLKPAFLLQRFPTWLGLLILTLLAAVRSGLPQRWHIFGAHETATDRIRAAA